MPFGVDPQEDQCWLGQKTEKHHESNSPPFILPIGIEIPHYVKDVPVTDYDLSP
jgi:hypothetical protein